MARPKKEISKEIFENLCAIGCTKEEIAFVIGVCEKSLSNWCKRVYNDSFYNVYKKREALYKISLRRMQFNLAEKSAAMAIWLGKQYLGQTDKPQENTDIEDLESYFEDAGI